MNTPNTQQQIVCLVEKEIVPDLRFPATDVLSSEAERIDRQQSLMTGLSLGNGARRKVKIVFSDTECIKQVETTIWAITEKNVVLKRGACIPIHRVMQVSFY